jgi:hypothetical protein
MTTSRPLLPTTYRLVSRETLGSTNDEATRLAREGAAEGTVIWALAQTAGRGRRGRSWSSPRGNLYASLILRPACPPGPAAQLGFVVASSDAGAARMFGRHQPEIGHQLARVGKAREVAQFGDQGCGVDQRHAAHRLQRRHHRGQCPVRQHRCNLRRQPIARRLGDFDRLNVILEHEMMRPGGEPPAMQPGPGRPPVMTAVAQQKPLLAGRLCTASSRARTRSPYCETGRPVLRRT